MPKRNCDICCEKHDTLRCQACVDKAKTCYVMNGLLTYVWSYVNEYSPASLKDALIRHFDPVDISQARSVLQNAVKNILPNYREIQGNRASSSGRERHDVEADDICGVMLELSNLIGDEAQQIPVFVVDDVRKIPNVAPEEHNVVSVLQKVLKMQQRIDEIASSVETNQMRLVSHDTELSTCKSRIEILEKKGSYASCVRGQQHEAENVNQVISEPQATAETEPKRAVVFQANPVQHIQPGMTWQNRNQQAKPRTPRQMTANTSTSSVTNDKKEGQNNEEWQQQRNRRRRPTVVGS